MVSEMLVDALPHPVKVTKERNDEKGTPKVDCLVANMTVSVRAARRHYHPSRGNLDQETLLERQKNLPVCGACGFACMN